MDDKQAPKMGRPPAEIDEKVLEALCQVQATNEEIAAYFEVSTRTIERLRQKPEYAAVFEKGRSTGRISLRRAQWKAALDGNPTMMIWLGKQELGQRDRLEVAGPAGGPVQIETVRRMLDNLSDADYGELAKETGVTLPPAAEGKEEEEVELPAPEPGEAA